LIFVAFLVPVALYLLILGYINRQPRPMIVSGTWDFIGALFASSGFLLCGGPAVLSSLSERWRAFWLLGEGSTVEALSTAGTIELVLAVLYFLLVIGIAALVLWRRRGLTSIYNVEAAGVEETLVEICSQLGLEPIRSGNLFVFGLSLETQRPRSAHAEAVQAPPHFPVTQPQDASGTSEETGRTAADKSLGQSAILEVESFNAFKHVTLHWEPHDSPLRAVLEAELDNRLGVTPAPYHDTGLWMTLAGFALLALSMLIVFGLVLRSLLVR
jgi:hypothetical protein